MLPNFNKFLVRLFLYKLYIKCLVTSKISFIFDLLIMYFVCFILSFFIFHSCIYFVMIDWCWFANQFLIAFLILSVFLFFEGVIFFYHFLIIYAFKFHFFVFQIQTMLDKKNIRYNCVCAYFLNTEEHDFKTIIS